MRLTQINDTVHVFILDTDERDRLEELVGMNSNSINLYLLTAIKDRLNTDFPKPKETLE